MAVVSIIDNIGTLRRGTHTPGKTGSRNPTPATEYCVKVKPNPSLVVEQRCVPKAYAYPKYLRIPIGPNEKGRYTYLRYACLRSTMRWLRVKQAITQLPMYHPFPYDLMPVGILDRNPTPASGTGVRRTLNRAAAVKDNVIPDLLWDYEPA